jgi:glutamate transport system substrate-binding protein
MPHRAGPLIATISCVLAAAGTAACTSAASTVNEPARPAVPQDTASTVTVRPQPSRSASCTASSAPVIGVKVDQYGTGYLDVRNYSYSGFDVDVADYVSGALFNDPNPYFLPVSSDTREQALASCAIRFFAATYTITPPRQAEFDIAGPYLVTYQGVMLGPHSPNITTVNQLDGRRVCVVGGGSQAESVLKAFVPQAIASPVQTYSSCLTQLLDGDVDAFSTDLAILYGYLGDPAYSGLKILPGVVIGNPIYYGIAFRKSDYALCMQAATAIEAMIRTKQWQVDIGLDLPKYVADQALYPSPLQPTVQEITANSCKP